ncbi:MAG: hypothetical protein DMG25_14090 [Acidobacteria bacterium]|nr:MAG: hypothetical protein DMG25_14090 [Acidobacteriota bacterium]
MRSQSGRLWCSGRTHSRGRSAGSRSRQNWSLSGCDTGVGKPEGEEGVANLVRAFLLAGASNVVASSWAAR